MNEIYKGHNVYLKKVIFNSHENIKSCISWMNWRSSAFSVDFLEPTLDFQTPITFLLVDKNTKFGYSFS